jgi:hypothetical protein
MTTSGALLEPKESGKRESCPKENDQACNIESYEGTLFKRTKKKANLHRFANARISNENGASIVSDNFKELFIK